MMIITYDLAKFKKVAMGGGVTAAIGTVFLEYYRIKRTLNQLINTDCLDVDKKRPDYIYIKYSIYRESMALLRQKEFDTNWVRVLVQPLGKWWKSVKHSVAWRLLEVAKTGDRHDRIKAVHQLARIDHLKDWDYQHLAQICDARTAVSLARHECDRRWFVRPRAHGSVRLPLSLIAEMRALLERLPPCACVPHLRANVLNNFAILRGFRADAADSGRMQPVATCKITQPEFVVLTQCLHAMFHLTRDARRCECLVGEGFLQTLMEVYKLFHRNVEVLFLLAKVLANLAQNRGDGDALAQSMFASGWIGVLAEMSRNPDLRVQVTAAKALANLDGDDHNGFRYVARVYPLYPKFCCRQRPEVDVVFVHGLLGGVFVTWRQKDREEPQLGLYGKNALFYSRSAESELEESTVEVLSSPPERQKRLCPSHAVARSVTEAEGLTGTVERAAARAAVAGKSEVLMYRDLPLVSRVPARKQPAELSDPATKELIATLQTAEEISDDWEVVYADCPVDGKPNSNGPFSVPGNQWHNDESTDSYTFCWPMDWLPVDHPTVRVLGVNYETALSEWYVNHEAKCPCEKSGTLHNRATDLLHALADAEVGANGRPVIWVCHSMGGLIAKSIMVQAAASSDPAVQRLADNTEAFVFLGTPHRGSAVAKLKQHTQLILSPTVEVKELEEDSAYLLSLHADFERYMAQHKRGMRILSVAEGEPTRLTTFKFPFHIVQEQSARLPVGEHYVLNVDHLGLSKPMYRQSFLYQRILAVVSDVLDAEQRRQRDEEAKSNAKKAGLSQKATAFENIADHGGTF